MSSLSVPGRGTAKDPQTGASATAAAAAGEQDASRSFQELDTADAIQVLKIGGAIGMFFVLAFLVVDLRRPNDAFSALGFYHWIIIAVVCAFFGVTWTQWFRKNWQLWTLILCAVLIALFGLISSVSKESDSRFVTIILATLTTASFVRWAPRWQLAMNVVCVVAYAVFQLLAPLNDSNQVHRWLGLLAAVIIAQFTTVFIGRFRRELRGQLIKLENANHFRERQIAIMAHDIRNPISALAGFVNLLEDSELSEKDRAALLARIGSTANTVQSVVGSVLDIYMLDEGRLDPQPKLIDPNPIVAGVVEDCTRDARRKGLQFRADLVKLPMATLDPRHFERILAYLANYAIGRTAQGEVHLKTQSENGNLSLEIDDMGPALDSSALASLFGRPDSEARSTELAPYIAASLIEKSGGAVRANCLEGQGLSIIATLPVRSPLVN